MSKFRNYMNQVTKPHNVPKSMTAEQEKALVNNGGGKQTYQLLFDINKKSPLYVGKLDLYPKDLFSIYNHKMAGVFMPPVFPLFYGEDVNRMLSDKAVNPCCLTVEDYKRYTEERFCNNKDVLRKLNNTFVIKAHQYKTDSYRTTLPNLIFLKSLLPSAFADLKAENDLLELYFQFLNKKHIGKQKTYSLPCFQEVNKTRLTNVSSYCIVLSLVSDSSSKIKYHETQTIPDLPALFLHNVTVPHNGFDGNSSGSFPFVSLNTAYDNLIERLKEKDSSINDDDVSLVTENPFKWMTTLEFKKEYKGKVSNNKDSSGYNTFSYEKTKITAKATSELLKDYPSFTEDYIEEVCDYINHHPIHTLINIPESSDPYREILETFANDRNENKPNHQGYVKDFLQTIEKPIFPSANLQKTQEESFHNSDTAQKVDSSDDEDESDDAVKLYSEDDIEILMVGLTTKIIPNAKKSIAELEGVLTKHLENDEECLVLLKDLVSIADSKKIKDTASLKQALIAPFISLLNLVSKSEKLDSTSVEIYDLIRTHLSEDDIPF